MKPISNWNEIQTNFDRIEPGYYKGQILDAKEVKRDWGDAILFSFDIVDGPHARYFKIDYQNQTGEKKWRGTLEQTYSTDIGVRFFKGLITAIEESNPGYKFNFDEATLKGKYVGIGFRREFYINKDNEEKSIVKAFTFRDINKLDGLEPPEDKHPASSATAKTSAGYASSSMTPPGYQTPGAAEYNPYAATAQSAPKFEEIAAEEDLPF